MKPGLFFSALKDNILSVPAMAQHMFHSVLKISGSQVSRQATCCACCASEVARTAALPVRNGRTGCEKANGCACYRADQGRTCGSRWMRAESGIALLSTNPHGWWQCLHHPQLDSLTRAQGGWPMNGTEVKRGVALVATLFDTASPRS